MKGVRFWGTRGSLPVALTAAGVRAKLLAALRQASGRTLATEADLDRKRDRDERRLAAVEVGRVRLGDLLDWRETEAPRSVTQFHTGKKNTDCHTFDCNVIKLVMIPGTDFLKGLFQDSSRFWRCLGYRSAILAGNWNIQ